MADNLNQKSIYVETDYDNIILVDPNKIVINNEVKERLVNHEDLVFYANLETKVIPRTKLAIGDSFDSPVINTSIASLQGNTPNDKINFLQPYGSKNGGFDTSWSDQLTGSGAREGKGINQTTESVQQRDGKIVYNRSVGNYQNTQLLGIKDISVNISGLGVPTVKINLVDVQGRTLFEQGEKSIYSVFFNLPYPLFYLTLKGYYGKAIRYALNLTKFNASFDQRTGNYNIELNFIGRTTGLLTDTLLTYAKTAPKMTPTTIQVKPTTTTNQNATKSNVTTTESSIGEQTLKEVYAIYKSKGLIDPDFPEVTIDEFIEDTDNFASKMQEGIKNGDFVVLSDVSKFRDELLEIKDRVYTVPITKYLDTNNYIYYKGQKYYPFKENIDYQKRETIISDITSEIAATNNNLKSNASFGDNASYTIGNITIKNQINVKLDHKDIFEKVSLTQLTNDDFKKTLAVRLGRQPSQEELSEFIKQTTQEFQLYGKKIDNQTGNLVDDIPTLFKYGEFFQEEGEEVKYKSNSFLDDIDIGLKKIKATEESIETEFTNQLSDKIIKEDGGIGFKPTIRNIFAIIMAGVDTFYRLLDKTHTNAWNQRTNPIRVNSIIPSDKNFGIDSKNIINGVTQQLNDANTVYPWPTYFIKEKQKDDKSGRELYTVNYIGDAKNIQSTQGNNYTAWPEISFLEDYISASVKKAPLKNRSAYNNPTEASKYGSCNTLEFPFDTFPYEDISEISFFYEIYERLYTLVNYTNIYRGNYKTLQVDKFLADMEAKNIMLGSSDSISLKEKLKTSKFSLETLRQYLKSISNKGIGDSWSKYERDEYVKDYIANMIKTDTGIYSLSTIDGRSISLENTVPLITEFEKFLKGSEQKKLTFLDTLPFTDKTWTDNNFSQTPEELNDTSKTVIFLDDKKTIARINESPDVTNIKPFYVQTKSIFNNYNVQILTNKNTGNIKDYLTFKNFYINRERDNCYITEKRIVYNETYSGNVGSTYQSTSFLNTPYFINSILDGVEKEKEKNLNPYISTGYLFLNSLPLQDTYGYLVDFEKEELVESLATTLKKFSAIHQIPYALLLKFGSVWHRYKKYEEEGVDILDDVWKDFDYKKYYDPSGYDLNREYTIVNYTGGTESFRAYRNETTPDSKTTDVFNYGMYPKLINDFHYFFTKQDLFNNYDQTEFEELYTKGKLKIGFNTEAIKRTNYGIDSNNPNRSIINTSYYQYLIFDKVPLIDTANKVFFPVPSCGGIPLNQANYECFNSSNKLTIEMKENPSVYNGTVRSFWGAPQFGYFDNNSVTKPKHTEFLDNIENSYADIQTLFACFDKKTLDKFESAFLAFCKPNPTYTDLNTIEKETTLYKQESAEYKQLSYVLKKMFTLTDDELKITNQQNNDGKEIAQKQVYKFTKYLEGFLNFDVILKLANAGGYDRKVFDSFVNDKPFKPVDPIIFSPYVKGILPGLNQGTTLLNSQASFSAEWKTLKTHVGFSTLPGVEYTDTGSTITDFFIDMNVGFTEDNIKNLAQLIKIFAKEKHSKVSNGEPFSDVVFRQSLKDFLLEREGILSSMVTEVSSYLNKNLPNITITNKNTKSVLEGNVTKLSMYNTFQAFNDKWIAGSDLTSRTIFEDFLFHDTANHDIGDQLQVDIIAVKDILKTKDPATDILLIIGDILKVCGDMLFFSMPAYINFYGLNSPTKTPTPLDIDIPNSLFGTWTNVNYLDSRPKFICVYVGKQSERPQAKENEFVLYADDSFDLRNPTTCPLRIATDKQNPSVSNKIVGFNVDFGIRNQNMFSSINVSMNDKKPTNATFLVNDQMANGVNGDKLAQQTTSLYSLYKSMSYACTVTSMGNVMIQPLMYFNLRHVPLFYGPYYIHKVKHTISSDKFETEFEGSRMPKYALPQPDSLATFIRANYLENFKSEILKQENPGTKIQEVTTLLDPENQVNENNLRLKPEEDCQLKVNEIYKTLPYVALNRTTITFEDLKTLINDNVTLDRTIKTLIFTIATSRPMNILKSGTLDSPNNNLFEISAVFNNFGSKPEFKSLICYDNGTEGIPMFSFDNKAQSIKVLDNWYKGPSKMVTNLNTLNTDINLTPAQIEQKTIAQLILTTWDTFVGVNLANPLNEQGIRNYVLDNISNDTELKSKYELYQKRVEIVQTYFPL
jgi:hypothetical protein